MARSNCKNIGFWFSLNHYDCKNTGFCIGLLPEHCFCCMFSCCQDEDSIQASSWQQESMQKNRVLAIAWCRTLCFYGLNGLEKNRTLRFHGRFGVGETRTLHFRLHFRTEAPANLIWKRKWKRIALPALRWSQNSWDVPCETSFFWKKRLKSPWN